MGAGRAWHRVTGARCRWFRTGLILGVTVLFVLVATSGGLLTPSLRSSRAPTQPSTPQVPVNSIPRSADAPRTAQAPGPPRVTDTLVLFNNTLVPGNFLAGNGLMPSFLTYDNQTGEVFASDLDSNLISVVSDTTNEVEATIWSGSPAGLAFDSGKGEVFASDNAGSNVSVISVASEAVIATVTVGTLPRGIAYDSAKGEIFVANSGSNSVSVISDSNNTVVATIPVSYCSPTSLAYDNGTGELFVACQVLDTVAVISDSNNTVVGEVNVGNWSSYVVYDSSKHEVFVSLAHGPGWDYAPNVSVISDSNNSVVDEIPLGNDPGALSVDPQRGEVFAVAGTNTVDIISDTNDSVVASTRVGIRPAATIFDAGTGELFTANAADSNLSVISDSTNKVVATIAVASVPWGLAYDNGANKILLANPSGVVSVINATSNSIIANVTTSLIPQQVAYDRGMGELFVSDAASDNVTVIDDRTDQVVTDIPVAGSPFGIAYDQGTNEVFVADLQSASVSVISDVNNSVVATVPLEAFPESVVYDDVTDEIFVAYANSNNVTVISDATDSVVTTIRMAGTNANSPPDFWGVGMALDARLGEVVVPTPWSGKVYVLSDVTDSVVASIQVGDEGSYSSDIAFDNESGDIFVTNNVTDNVTVISMSNDSIIERIAVGACPWYDAFDPLNGEVYVSNENQGTLSIIYGGPRLNTSSVRFTEEGLPSGSNWTVTIAGSEFAGNNSTISVTVTNGVWSWGVVSLPVGWMASPSAGDLAIIGAGVEVAIVASPVSKCSEGAAPASLSASHASLPTVALDPRAAPSPASASNYTVTFSESGLPSGASWIVAVNGSEMESTLSSISVPLENGSWSWGIVSLPTGWFASPMAGVVILDGAGGSVPIATEQFAQSCLTYSVTFTESGLAPPVEWAVNFSGLVHNSTSSSITYSEPNGTYPFLIPTVPGYGLNLSSGSIVVDGGPVAVEIGFSNTNYSVVFTESGLPLDSLWTITATNLGNQHPSSGQSTESEAVLQLPNGTYSLSAMGPTGYTVRLSTQEILISGSSPAPVLVTFAATPTGVVTASSIPWAVTGSLVVVALVGVVGAGWGYNRYRYAKGKTEGLAWVQEFHEDAAKLDQRPPR